jgi:hypothetical protein
MRFRFPVWSSASVIIGVCFWLAFAPHPAHAYIDPGTGSYLLQLLIGGLFAAAFTLKAFWGRIRTYLARVFRKPQDGVNE